MKYDQLIRLYFERSNAIQSYWTLYVVVIGGLLAISSLRMRRDLFTVCLVTVMYALFAYKNLGAIQEVATQRIAILEAIHRYSDADLPLADAKPLRQLLEPTLVQPPYGGIAPFHATCDILTIAMLWAMELRRIRNQHAVDANIVHA